MKHRSSPPEIGSTAHVPVGAHGGSWVQTERASHEAWGRLAIKYPIASALMHMLVARMGKQNAVVVSQKTLAALVGVTDRSIRTAVQILVAGRWVQVIRLNGPGTVCGYVVNSQVSWGEAREKLHLSVFTATVVADAEDQDFLDHTELRKIPMIYQAPEAEGLSADAQERAELEARGQLRIDNDTGEILGM